jgi:hypothetical protein
MKTSEDEKEMWHHKNICDQAMRLAAICNKSLIELYLVQNNTQIINYHYEFVIKRLENK